MESLNEETANSSYKCAHIEWAGEQALIETLSIIRDVKYNEHDIQGIIHRVWGKGIWDSA